MSNPITRALFSPRPTIGEKFVLSGHESNPFDRDCYTVEVVDLKEKWVQYKFASGSISSQSIRMFNSMYLPLRFLASAREGK